MSAVRERGEGRLGTILGLLFLAAVIYMIWNVAPVYVDHYSLVDKMNELARAPKYNHPDDRIFELLAKYAREERIEGITRHSFTISTLDTSRRISVEYSREAQVLPGWKHKFKFSKMVDQPLI